jgi:ABC-type transporter Mla subunit MlaD
VNPADERPPAEPAALLQSLLPGLAWTQALVESTGRAQAAAAADALRRVNAPAVAALEQQREAAEALAALAEQMAAMAEQLGRVARHQAELTRQLQTALQPYQNYIDWLERAGKAGG